MWDPGKPRLNTSVGVSLPHLKRFHQKSISLRLSGTLALDRIKARDNKGERALIQSIDKNIPCLICVNSY